MRITVWEAKWVKNHCFHNLWIFSSNWYRNKKNSNLLIVWSPEYFGDQLARGKFYREVTFIKSVPWFKKKKHEDKIFLISWQLAFKSSQTTIWNAKFCNAKNSNWFNLVKHQLLGPQQNSLNIHWHDNICHLWGTNKA